MKPLDPDRLMSVTAAARQCGVSRATIHRLIDDGSVIRYTVGRKRTAVSVDDVRAALAPRPGGAA